MWRRQAGLVLLLLLSSVALAHERFVRHDLKVPLRRDFFIHQPGAPGHILGVNNNIWLIGAHTAGLIGLFLTLWFLRRPLTELVMKGPLRHVRGEPQRFFHQVASFLTDRPVRSVGFGVMSQWVVILFLRSPGLVLMYSAANDSLVMPSFPLDPPSAAFFKFAQVGLALLILTQSLLPLCGALVFGTWLYLFRWGAMVAVDALPVLSVALVYLAAPWGSHRVAITEINKEQMRWVRLSLGLGFFLLGWFKVINHNLTAGVADNYPSVMEDPLINLLAHCTDPAFKRECWIVSFAMAEVMSGFLLMMGVFTRVWCLFMAYTFTKLMLVDFGWEEIPHIYPIGALLAVLFSNNLSSEFDRIEDWEERLGWRQQQVKRGALILGVSAGIAAALIFPLHFVITFFNRYDW